MEPSADPHAPVLAVRGVGKRFGPVTALAGVDLDFHAGEVHALLGENGAGKSTLMYILAGVSRPDTGTLRLDGQPVRFTSPRAARDAGIGMVHQHFTLVDRLTVTENLALSLPGQHGWLFRPAATAAAARAFAAQVGLQIGALDVPVGQLPVGTRQRLEILKALASASRILILDEPTAVLTPQEARQLFAMLRHLRTEGRLIIFITHKLREVGEIADRVTIMRRGRVVGTDPVAALTERAMAERMIGAVVADPRPGGRVLTDQPPALRVAGVRARDRRGMRALDDVSFAVSPGEIFGIAGVDGNGQRELFDVLAGASVPDGGSVAVGTTPLTTFTPAAALAAGISHIPPDRQGEGLVLAMSVAENLVLNRRLLDRFSRRGVLRRDALRRFATDLTREYGVQFAGLDAPVRSLSGGNQQRIVVARTLAQTPRVLVTVNPTRGLDFAASAAVGEALRAAAARGCAVVLISTDLDEVLALSDRVGVLYRGRLSPPLVPPVDTDQIGLLMAGAAASSS